MPELPEVEVIARGLAASLTGRRIQRVHALWPTSIKGTASFFASVLEGATVTGVRRRAKLLLLELDTARTLAVHLKMTGRMVLREPGAAREKHDRVRFDLEDGGQLVFSDMRRFGYLAAFLADDLANWDFYKNLGPEPLEMSAGEFVDRLHERGARIKSLLLDQRVIAGIGNIYADESLFRAGIHPRTPANTVSKQALKGLFRHLGAVLRKAIQENGSSIRDYRDAGGNAGAFQNAFQVYGKSGKPCVKCGQTLEKTLVSGRTSTYCPGCQK